MIELLSCIIIRSMLTCESRAMTQAELNVLTPAVSQILSNAEATEDGTTFRLLEYNGTDYITINDELYTLGPVPAHPGLGD